MISGAVINDQLYHLFVEHIFSALLLLVCKNIEMKNLHHSVYGSNYLASIMTQAPKSHRILPPVISFERYRP